MSLPTIYQQYIHTSRYARYDESIGRRVLLGKSLRVQWPAYKSCQVCEP